MIKRQGVRAILLTPQEEVLLMRVIEPVSRRAFWLTPGGGADDGEDKIATLKRELLEEVGRNNFEIGPEVWRRDHQFSWDERLYHQIDHFYLVRTSRFTPTTDNMPDQIELDAFDGFHWWPLPEIEQSDEVFVPRRLGTLLRDLIKNGSPPVVVEVGV